jgi:hypothetical protein
MAALFSVAPAAFAAKVSVVHGIDGRDLGLARDLPVDIAVNGECALKGVKFKQSTIVDLPAADYTLTVHLADGSCSQDPVITKQLTIPEGPRLFSAVASLSSSGAPQIAVFNNSELFLPSTISVRHLAKAGAVTVKYSSPELGKSQSSRIRNGKQAILGVLSNRVPYTANIYPGTSKRSIARLTGVGRKKFTIHNIVGSSPDRLTIITEKLAP